MMSKLFTYCLLFWSIAGIFSSPTNLPNGEERALYQFAIITVWITGHNPLDYVGYGCHCGVGKKGSKIVDALDQCCATHDKCYNNVVYDYNFRINDIQCTDQSETIAYKACQCDRQAVLCFRSSPYNSTYQNYPANKC